MGIDIYARWRGHTQAESEAQVTGFSPVAGNVGYLREPYHGGPYVTKYFVTEAFAAPEREARPAKPARSPHLLNKFTSSMTYEIADVPVICPDCGALHYAQVGCPFCAAAKYGPPEDEPEE